MRLDTTQLQLSSGQNLTLNDNSDIQWGGSADRKIKNTTGGFEFEVETGDTFQFTIQDTAEYIFNATQLDMNQNNIIDLPGTFISALTTVTALTGDFVLISDTSDTGNLKKINASDFLTGGAEVFTWTADHSTGGNTFLLTDDASPPAGTVMFINSQATDMHFNVSDADTFNWTINAVAEMTLSTSALTLATMNIDMSNAQDIRWAGSANRRIFNDTGGFNFDVEDTDNFDWTVNGVSEMTLDAGGLTLVGTNILAMSDATEIRWGGDANRRINNSLATGFIFEVLTGDNFDFQIVNVSNMTLSATSLDLVGTAKNITQIGSGAVGFHQMAEITDPAAGTASGKYYVKDVAGVSKPFYIGEGQTAVDLTAGTGSQTPWATDIDAASFDLRDLSNLEFVDPTTAAPAAGVNAIYVEAAGMVHNVPTGNSLAFSINDVDHLVMSVNDADFGNMRLSMNSAREIRWADSANRQIRNLTTGFEFEVETGDSFNFEIQTVNEMTLNATTLDILGNDLNNVKFLTSNAGAPALAGAIRLGNVEAINWRNQAGSADFGINLNTLNAIEFDAPLDMDDNDIILNDTGVMRFNDFTGNNVRLVLLPTGTDKGFRVEKDGLDGFKLALESFSNSSAVFDARIVANTTGNAVTKLEIQSEIVPANDTGTAAVMHFNSRQNDVTNIVARDLFRWTNNATLVATVAFDGNWNFNNHELNAVEHLEVQDRVVPVTPAAGFGRVYLDSADDILKIVHNDTTVVSLEAAGGSDTPWIVDHDAADFSLTNLDILDFNDVTGTPAAAATQIWRDGAIGMLLNVPLGDDFEFRFNGSVQYTMNQNNMNFEGRDINGVDAYQPGTSGGFPAGTVPWFAWDAAIWGFNVPVLDAFNFRVNGSTELEILAGTIDIKGNRLELFSTTHWIEADGGGNEYNVATGDVHDFQVNVVPELLIGASSIKTGNVVTPMWDFERTTAQADGYVIGELRWRHDDGLGVLQNYARITGVMDEDVNATEDGSIHFFVTENGVHDVQYMNWNDDGLALINVFRNINMSEASRVQWNSTVERAIFNDTSGFQFKVEAADTYDFQVATVSEMTLSATQLDLFQNSIQFSTDGHFIAPLATTFDFQAANSGDTIRLRTGTNDRIAINNTGAIFSVDIDLQANALEFIDANMSIRGITNDLEYDVADTNTHRWRVNNVTAMELSASNLNLADGSSLTINATGATGFIDLDEITIPANPAALFGRLYTKLVTDHAELFFLDQLGTETNVLTGTETTTWTANHDAAGFNLLNLNELEIENIAGDFQYTITGSAIIADRIITLPLLTAGDTMVTEAFAQTLTGKTINADGTGNVITNIGSSEIKSQIITGNSTVLAAAGDFILITDGSDSDNLRKVNAFDFLGAGSQTPWLAQ